MEFRTLNADEIDVRVQQVSKNGSGFSVLLYKDARCDMNILDETVTPERWQRRHVRDNANCIVSIYFPDVGWVDKEDTGTESNTEAQKGLASDSFKRACVNWGIGRELYTSPFIWISAQQGDVDEYKGKYRLAPSVKLSVSEIGYDDKRRINKLVIVDNKGNTRYSFGSNKKPQRQKQAQQPAQMACERCGAPITGDKTHTPQAWADGVKKHTGMLLCRKCFNEWSREVNNA